MKLGLNFRPLYWDPVKREVIQMECLIAFNMAGAVKWLITLSGNFPLVFKVNFANFTAQTEEREFQTNKAENI